MQSITEILNLLDEVDHDAEKFERKGCKAAGVRARVKLARATKMIKAAREEILEKIKTGK